MSDAIEFFSYFALSQLIMAILILLPHWHKNQSIRLYIALMICCCSYVVEALFAPFERLSLQWWLQTMLVNALPGVFWLVSLSVFGERGVLKTWQYLVASLTLLVPFSSESLQLIFSFELSNFVNFHGIVKYGTLSLELVLICHALIIAINDWHDDLVQERRYIRGGVIGVVALYIFATIVLEQLFAFDWSWLELVKKLILALLVTAINFLMFKLCESSLFEPVKQKSQVKEYQKPHSKELTSVIESMTIDKLYKEDGLTIALLAKKLAIHEYRLRQLINGELVYRNFNDFLNFYRIQEVTEKLGEQSSRQLPVLTLALESGFRSLSSFNKAFKSKHGVTPTEYRKKELAN